LLLCHLSLGPSSSLEEVGRKRGEERKIKERDRVVSLFM
jgi:hypothetical protein